MIETLSIVINSLAIFIVAPFLVLVAVPAIVIPNIVSKIVNKKNKLTPSIGWFSFYLIIGGLLSYIFWMIFIRNVLYHEWDPVFMPPYSFFGREPISLNGHGSWLASGWKEWHLDLIWAGLTLLTYFGAGFFAWFKNLKSPQIMQYFKTLKISIASLIVVTMIFPKLYSLSPKPMLNTFSSPYKFQENSAPCTKNTNTNPRILYHYNAANGEVITDLDGKNEEIAYKHDVQLRGNHALFSPDQTRVVALQAGWNKLWILCTYSQGARVITIPEYAKNHFVAPHGHQMVQN